MATFALGIGTSHGPTMSTPWEEWLVLAKKDLFDERLKPSTLVEKPELQPEIADERRKARHAAYHGAITALKAQIEAARIDTFVVVSNPHKIFDQEPQPVFGIYLGDSVLVAQDTGSGEGRRRFDYSVAPRALPSDVPLAKHLMNALIDDGFDLACTDRFRDGTMLEDAYAMMYQHYFDQPRPLVPVTLSRYRPNQATPARCYAFGQALRRAIERWDEKRRVAVVASGGLSHQIVDEELDHSVIAALQSQDVAALKGLDRDRLNAAPGTPEILNWVTVAGVAEDVPMTLIDYIPAYRSLLGTGHGLTYGYWTGS
jgi:aromatic ring-opening dioxygenase LigB subunit